MSSFYALLVDTDRSGNVYPLEPVDAMKRIKEAVATSPTAQMRPSQHRQRMEQLLRPYRIAYDGGEEAVRFLIRRPGESPQQWRSRGHHFENVPLIEQVVEEMGSSLYGRPPKRCVKYRVDGGVRTDEQKAADDDLDKAFSQIYDDNEAPSLFRDDVSTHVWRDTYCAVKTFSRPDVPGVSMAAIPPESVLFVGDPNDRRTYYGTVETVRFGSQYRHWLWTLEWYAEISDSWDILSGPEDNPVMGVVPFTLFGRIPAYGKHHMATLLQQQRSAINDQSTRQLGKRAQAFSVPVLSGHANTPETVDPVTGEKYQRIVGPDGGVHLREGGSFTFAQPNFNLAQITDDNNSLLRMYLGMARVSQFALSTSEAPDQPMALAIKERRALAERQRWVNILKVQEKRLAETVLAYAAVYIDDFPLIGADVDIDIEFDQNVLPIDRNIERTADASDVAAARAPRKWYVGKWLLPEADEQEIAEFLAEADAEASARADRLGAALAVPGREAPNGAARLAGIAGRLSDIGEGNRSGVGSSPSPATSPPSPPSPPPPSGSGGTGKPVPELG
jgi:hypothetical protein